MCWKEHLCALQVFFVHLSHNLCAHAHTHSLEGTLHKTSSGYLLRSVLFVMEYQFQWYVEEPSQESLIRLTWQNKAQLKKLFCRSYDIYFFSCPVFFRFYDCYEAQFRTSQ